MYDPIVSFSSHFCLVSILLSTVSRSFDGSSVAARRAKDTHSLSDQSGTLETTLARSRDNYLVVRRLKSGLMAEWVPTTD
jgi:hypothetical protein